MSHSNPVTPLRAIRPALSLQKSWLRSHPRNWNNFMRQLDRSGTPYLSHSKVTSLEKCPLCYYREYVLGEKQDSPALHRGGLFHQAAKAFYGALKIGQRIKPSISSKQIHAKSLPAEILPMLRNALELLRKNWWQHHDILAVEECFFMDLAAGLPPIIGIPDLLLRHEGSLILVDHKISTSFKVLDSSQLVLYAENLRRQYATNCIVGVFDEYRLVPDLSTINKPAFRRTPVSVDRSFLPNLISRYRRAWKKIISMQKNGEPNPSPDCRTCNFSTYSDRSYYSW
jgi:hypothetical protein